MLLTMIGIFVDPDDIPTLSMEDATKQQTFLNCYALDFYKHGQLEAIEQQNMLRRRAWDALKDWSLTLKTIKTTLEKLSEDAPATGPAKSSQKWTLEVVSHLSDRFAAKFNALH